ncbi:L-threonylcarbamoyladenylate synthase [Leptospira interrogans]|uniref:Translation factor Sua5 n=22 Tax=Leptospira interrogans TaxID=173 RepID=Q8FA16_LEPIN|nr:MULTISPECIES: L-threonylcarbamoyladenylate synthase [Leptospira]EMF41986.1 tRNA threonylcarbamoyl adenosine modification protein, Sua5/YciO/YrdC/YwlC family [Leptospira interrogans serovar Lora str. TE 1992]EMF72206.1 tRNA threonylcarbamoyl adenosine modification protein, Sua5/YciO/YrdC/YwlC family [Leptospira interrogans serovar Canicola str. LT1962]EMG22389.1 tRNA threonylcarbamoyl adenosine modification protein, Sua5/YciO/YrdC/YwlC family [Leptospira interrogans serovar Copenhageni str. LT
MILSLHSINPEKRKLQQISDQLSQGKIYIFPTDTVYALLADSQSKLGVEKLYELKNISKNQPLSLICPSISIASNYIEHLSNDAFRLMKKITPGPFTFITSANKHLPRVSFSNQKEKQIGIRIPDAIYLQELMKIHPNPLTSTSVFANDEFIIEVDSLEKIYGSRVEGIVDGGILKVELSTILDLTGDEITIIREGKGFELL